MSDLEIWGTLGPKCCDAATLKQLILAGMNGIRLNLSHSSLDECSSWIEELHRACRQAGKEISLLIDMKGPEIRLDKFNQPIVLEKGKLLPYESLPLDPEIVKQIKEGMHLEIDDGKIILQADPNGLVPQEDGCLLSGKSVYIRELPELVQNQNPLTADDLINLKQARRYGVTALMQPFVQNRQMLESIRKSLQDLRLDLKVYAKIENSSGVKNLPDFYDLADCIVIARGDLANDAGLENIGAVQHEIEQFCRAHHKPWMVVTQMLDSMRLHPSATRAEISDVFHAVYNGASAIMLTGETASGNYPVSAMETFSAAANSALKILEKENNQHKAPDQLNHLRKGGNA